MLSYGFDAIFRLIGYMAVWFMAVLLVGMFVYPFLADTFGVNVENPELTFPYVTVEGITFLIAVLAAALYGLKQLDRRPWSSVGIRLYPKAFLELTLGLGLGSLLVLILWAVDAVWHSVGEGAAIVWPHISLPLDQIPVVLVFMTFVAFNEELLMRGYPLQSLIRSFGIVPAVMATSLAFGSLHLTGDVWNSAVVMLDTAFAGAVFAMCYVKTKALWMPIGVHFANNVTIFLIDAPDLSEINFIPPEVSQDVFLGWWWMNFPVYVVALILISRWHYKPDATMQNFFDTYIARKVKVEADQNPDDDAEVSPTNTNQ